ncbi:MAG: hypothetical protein JWO05_2118 [Gemmatimonadetes bacterium]|nr:hypothetical protein [Gemmatimonadota bacterium]
MSSTVDPTFSTTVASSRPARLGRYSLWMFRDYVLNQGPATILVVGLLAYVTIAPAKAMMQASPRAPQGMHEWSPLMLAQMLRSLLGTFVFLATLFATNGLISNDKKLGYYRFLFAKPVSAPTYYATAFLANGVGVMLVAGILYTTWCVATGWTWFPWLFPMIALMYLAYGGIAFLLSAITRFDWLSLVSVLFAANIVWDLWGPDATGWRWFVQRLLPPANKTTAIYSFATSHFAQADWKAMVWLGGYGALCFVLGLLWLRKRPLAAA